MVSKLLAMSCKINRKQRITLPKIISHGIAHSHKLNHWVKVICIFLRKKEEGGQGTCVRERVGHKHPIALALTPRQQGYILGAIKRLIKRNKVKVSNPTELKDTALLCRG